MDAHAAAPQDGHGTGEVVFNFARALVDGADGARKSDRTRATIMAAICRILNRASHDGIKVADICTEAGVAHGTFYNYFNDLPDALDAVLRDFVAFVQNVMRGASGGRGAGGTRAATAAYLDLFAANPGLMRCLISPVERFPEARRAFQKLNREWTRTVADAAGRRMGAASPGSAELLRRAYALGGMVDQYLTALLLTRDETVCQISRDREAVLDTLTLIWQRGLAP